MITLEQEQELSKALEQAMLEPDKPLSLKTLGLLAEQTGAAYLDTYCGTPFVNFSECLITELKKVTQPNYYDTFRIVIAGFVKGMDEVKGTKQATALEDLRTRIVNEKKLVHTPDAALVAYDKILTWIDEHQPAPPATDQMLEGKCPNCDTLWPASKIGSQCQRCDSITILPYNPPNADPPLSELATAAKWFCSKCKVFFDRINGEKKCPHCNHTLSKVGEST